MLQWINSYILYTITRSRLYTLHVLCSIMCLLFRNSARFRLTKREYWPKQIYLYWKNTSWSINIHSYDRDNRDNPGEGDDRENRNNRDNGHDRENRPDNRDDWNNRDNQDNKDNRYKVSWQLGQPRHRGQLEWPEQLGHPGKPAGVISVERSAMMMVASFETS